MSGSNVGVWTNLNSVDPRGSTRSYSATAYYHPNSSRPNLRLLTGAEVKEILISRQDKDWIAKGVRFTHSGRDDFKAYAAREVIISAGSVQSPQLLERSGIGGATVLSRAGILTKVDNQNVGENLQDHLSKLIQSLQ